MTNKPKKPYYIYTHTTLVFVFIIVIVIFLLSSKREYRKVPKRCQGRDKRPDWLSI